MSAELLRRAARVLGREALGLLPSPWRSNSFEVFDADAEKYGPDQKTNMADVISPKHADYIALMHPPVALALADWLDAAARVLEAHGDYFTSEAAIAVARTILREQP